MTEQMIFDWYVEHGLSAAGAAGMTANICIESAYNSQNLQNSYEKKLGYTDKSYTAAVDSGKYKKFSSDRAGYGYCQWTSGGRKAGLLEYAKSKGVSIGDAVMQLEYSLKEMSTSLKNTLCSITDPYEAARLVMVKFERPANQSEANQRVRGNKGKEVCARCVKNDSGANEGVTMDIIKHYLTKNDCYKSGKKINIKGIVVHSTGCVNRDVTRYVDAPELGKVSAMHWNKSGIAKCVHGICGWSDKLKKVMFVQTLPDNMRPWGCASGGKGSYNNSHFQFEMCEDAGASREYFNQLWACAVGVCAEKCKLFGLTEKNIVSHKEAHALGYASNHGDPESYFKKYGKTMNDFRSDVKKLLGGHELAGDYVGDVETVTVETAKYKADKYKHTYEIVSQDGYLAMRTGAGKSKNLVRKIPTGETVQCYGYYNKDSNGKAWLYVTYGECKGYVHSGYLKAVK